MSTSRYVCALLIAGCAGQDGGPATPPDAGPDAASDAPTCTTATVDDTDPALAGPHVVVDVDTQRFGVGPVALGANINKWYAHAQGLWNPGPAAPNADAVAKAKRAHLGVLRYPGGTSANLFDWKRAVGPVAQRGCQIDGEDDTGHADMDYGPAEFMQLVRAIGAEPQIMVPFVVETPAHAADWVEYMNAPVGTNPNGGVAWADVRAAQGFAEPFHVTRWELGNEQDRGGHQAYWMATATGAGAAAADRRRLAQYIDGDDFAVVDQPAGRGCDLTQTTTTAAAKQTFYLAYKLVKAGTFPTVTVGPASWTRVDDLATASATAKVFAFDRERGAITFGDGVHGAIPPAGQVVKVSYRFHHDGFVAMYDAMKATAAEIGTKIDVCAIWAPPTTRGAVADLGNPSFAAAMKTRGLTDRYDCVAMHPYTNFRRDFGDVWNTPRDAHDETMLGDDWARRMVSGVVDDLAANATAGADGASPFVTISEMGALWFGSDPAGDQSRMNVPAAGYSMSHALYMASQFIHAARLHVGWVEGNTLVAEPGALRGTLGGKATGFTYSAEAMAREALGPVFGEGSTWVASQVADPVLVTAGAETYPALAVGSTVGADGALRIVVVNREPTGMRQVEIEPNHFAHGPEIEVTTVRGAAVGSANDGPDGPGDDSVMIANTTTTVTSSRFVYTFPPASVTVLTLRPTCAP